MAGQNIANMVSYMIAPLKRRIQCLAARAVVRLISDNPKIQEVQISLMSDEVKSGVEHFQPYGFTHHPHPGAEAAVVFLGGNRDHGIVVVVDDRRYRLKPLAAGEVALYTDEDQKGGHRVVMRRGRLIEVVCDSLSITADSDVSISAENIALSAKSEISETSQSHRVATGDYEARRV